ncbi:MAG: ROK family protein [Congregibacter sp.]|nr:ROK family protein [Congregibacter sp.]
MTHDRLLLGVDLGGTKIEAALLDGNGTVLHSLRTATPANDYPGLLAKVARLCDDLEAAVGLNTRLPLGICTPGSPSPDTGLMRNCNSTALNGSLLGNDLQNHCQRPIRMANDGDCLVLSEARDGAGRSAQSVFGVILGTGVGGGLSINGNLLQGPNAISGEWGHNPMPLARLSGQPDELKRARPCYCGRDDCIETWLSGAGLALTHEQLHGESVELRQLLEQQFDSKHRQTLDIYVRMLALALAGIINVVDPDVVVFAGGLSNIKLIFQAVPELLKQEIFSDVCRTQLRAAQHGDSSGVRGAARLWENV